MDDVDLATSHNELFQTLVIKNRPKPAPIPKGTGRCLHCSQPTEKGRWCSPLCRDEWEADHDAR